MRIFSYRNKRALRRALLIALLAVVLIGLLILARISYLGRYAVYSPDGVYFDKTQKLQREDVPAAAPAADPEEYPFETILSASSGEEETAYKQIEAVSCEKLLALLPPELQAGYRPLLFESDPGTAKIVKAADKLSAYIKCVEELKAGNSEFEAAARQTRQALCDMQLPCLDYFMAHFLDSFQLTLDELE